MAVARRLALGRLISLSGGSAAYIALVRAVYDGGRPLWVSAAIFSSVVATVASAPFAGWLGDRFDRRVVMIGADLAQPLSRWPWPRRRSPPPPSSP
jgi:MFS family permease